MQADNLHLEAALLSNRLHTFPADNLDEVRPLIAQILAKREEWRQVQKTVQYVQKTGKMPENRKNDEKSAPAKGNISELKLELSRLANLISKAKKKLEVSPDHKNAASWTEEMAKNEALRAEIRDKITDLTYAGA